MIRVVPVIILSALALSACQKSTGTDAAAETAAIKAVENALRDAYAARDAKALAALYDVKGTVYVPGERARAGAEAIAAGAARDFADPAFQITFTTGQVGVAASGDTGYSKGSFTVRHTDPGTKAPSGYSGYYLMLFAKQKDGNWRVMEDMASPAG